MSIKLLKFPVPADVGSFLMRYRKRIMQGAAVMLIGFGPLTQLPDFSTVELTDEIARSFLGSVRKAQWVKGDSKLIIWSVEGKDYWVILRGDLDAKSIVDKQGNAVEQRCIRIYAAPAVRKDLHYAQPSPYLVSNFGLMWQLIGSECRIGSEIYADYELNGKKYHELVDGRGKPRCDPAWTNVYQPPRRRYCS